MGSGAVTLTISLGDLLILASVALVVWKMGRRVWEHDMMWVDYCARHGITTRVFRSKINGGTGGTGSREHVLERPHA